MNVWVSAFCSLTAREKFNAMKFILTGVNCFWKSAGIENPEEKQSMEINLMELEPRQAHDLLTSALIPRPIAWVSTINKEGQTNLAPFIFFTGVSWSPPVLAFSVVTRADGTLKDTAKNIRDVPEFVVNLVSVDLLAPMEYSARPIPYGTDDLSITGIHWEPSKTIRPRRVQDVR